MRVGVAKYNEGDTLIAANWERVEAAYGRTFTDDNQWVAYLFELYQKLSGELFVDEKKRGKGMKR